MRIRTMLAAVAVALLSSFALVGVASAQEDLDCADFPTRTEAQDEFDKNTNDPYRLDADDDEMACETFPAEESSYVDPMNEYDTYSDSGISTDSGTDVDSGAIPDGAIEAGHGGTADGGAAGVARPLGVGAALVAGLGLLYGAAARRRG
jgi:hypothetical protein